MKVELVKGDTVTTIKTVWLEDGALILNRLDFFEGSSSFRATVVNSEGIHSEDFGTEVEARDTLNFFWYNR